MKTLVVWERESGCRTAGMCEGVSKRLETEGLVKDPEAGAGGGRRGGSRGGVGAGGRGGSSGWTEGGLGQGWVQRRAGGWEGWVQWRSRRRYVQGLDRGRAGSGVGPGVGKARSEGGSRVAGQGEATRQ